MPSKIDVHIMGHKRRNTWMPSTYVPISRQYLGTVNLWVL